MYVFKGKIVFNWSYLVYNLIFFIEYVIYMYYIKLIFSRILYM